jgi:hypothetical protein
MSAFNAARHSMDSPEWYTPSAYAAALSDAQQEQRVDAHRSEGEE